MDRAEAVMTRVARLDDIPAMARISADIWDGDDYIPRVARQWICDPQGRFIVAECDGVVRGFGRLAMHPEFDILADANAPKQGRSEWDAKSLDYTVAPGSSAGGSGLM